MPLTARHRVLEERRQARHVCCVGAAQELDPLHQPRAVRYAVARLQRCEEELAVGGEVAGRGVRQSCCRGGHGRGSRSPGRVVSPPLSSSCPHTRKLMSCEGVSAASFGARPVAVAESRRAHRNEGGTGQHLSPSRGLRLSLLSSPMLRLCGAGRNPVSRTVPVCQPPRGWVAATVTPRGTWPPAALERLTSLSAHMRGPVLGRKAAPLLAPCNAPRHPLLSSVLQVTTWN